MLVNVPVYNNHFGYHQINIYEQTEAGEFRRTPKRLMPHMLVNFDCLSESLGEVVAPAYDRRQQDWNTPTVYFYLGRPRSFFRFLRDHALDRQIMVLCTNTMSLKVRKFTIHELRFKRNVFPVEAGEVPEKSTVILPPLMVSFDFSVSSRS